MAIYVIGDKIELFNDPPFTDVVTGAVIDPPEVVCWFSLDAGTTVVTVKYTVPGPGTPVAFHGQTLVIVKAAVGQYQLSLDTSAAVTGTPTPPVTCQSLWASKDASGPHQVIGPSTKDTWVTPDLQGTF